MTLRHFQIFLYVHDEGGMTRAAEKLHISQPSVSQAIREMEEHYGTKLFERLGKKLFLTVAGEELLQYARHIAGLVNQSESAMQDFADGSPLRIGATLSVGESIVIPLLDRFRKIGRQRVYSYIHNTATLEKALLNDELDLALVEGNIHSPYLKEHPFMADELVFLAAPHNPIPRTISDLSQMPFITREVGSGTRELFTRIMTEQGIKPKIIGTYNNSESIKQAVMAGFGIAVLSERVANHELAAGKLSKFDIPGISFTRTFRIVCHVNKYQTPALENFIDLCGNFDDYHRL
jgi:DNA-binding transcriptional LysR family regulator